MPKFLTRFICLLCGKAYHSDEKQATMCNACLVELSASNDRTDYSAYNETHSYPRRTT